MQKYRFFKYVVALLLSICLSACNEILPSASMSEAQRGEQQVKGAKIYFGVGDYGLDGWNWEIQFDEVTMMDCTDIIVGTVTGHKISAHWKTEELEGFAALLVDIKIEQVLFGNFKKGDRVSLFQRAKYNEYTNVLYPLSVGGDLAGGFLQKNEKVLLFVERIQHKAFIEFHKDHPYEIVGGGTRLHYGRTVNQNGILGYREGNFYAHKDDFAECKTVQDVCNRIPQALNAYRDLWKKDHPLLATYRATPNAEPGVPENYVYYADLPKEAEKE